MVSDQFEFFLDPLDSDGELSLRLTECTPAAEGTFGVPFYTFMLHRPDVVEPIGRIRLRVGWNEEVIRYAGQIGYVVEAAHRGHHYAERACRLIAPLARRHGMSELWITSQPDNIASRRTLERLGAQFVEIVAVPESYPLDAGAERRKACYGWILDQPNLVPR